MTQPDPLRSSEPPSETVDVSAKLTDTYSDAAFDSPRDDDRLYTDEFIRENENASRQLLISFVTFFVVGVGAIIWFLVTQRPPAPVQPSLEPPPPPPTSVPPLPPSVPNESLPTQDGFPLPEPPISPVLPEQLPDTGEDVPAFPVPEGTQPNLGVPGGTQPNLEGQPNAEESVPSDPDARLEDEAFQSP